MPTPHRKDKSRKIKDSPLSETLAGAVGVGVGAGISFCRSLSRRFGRWTECRRNYKRTCRRRGVNRRRNGCRIGCFGCTGRYIRRPCSRNNFHFKNKKLRQSKELLYKTALAKQTAILKALKEESDADKERIEYLKSLSVLLQAAIQDLRCDLGYNS